MAYHSEVMVAWDPSDSYSNEVIAMQNMYETLTRYDSETQEVVPMLATSWESNEDGTTWTFTLLDDVTFHSGRAMTSEDVKASIERTLDRSGSRLHLGRREEDRDAGSADGDVPAEVLGPARSDGLGELRRLHLRHAGGRLKDLAEWFAEGNEAGTGPYMLDTWDEGADVELRLRAYPGYWGSGTRPTTRT